MKREIHKKKIEKQEEQSKELMEAYQEFDKFVLKMIIERKLTLMPLYFDNAMEGRRTYRADFRFLPSTAEDIESAPTDLEKLEPKKLDLI